MTHQYSNGTALKKDTTLEDCPLEMTAESEGGFPCGEFLWDEEEDVAAISGESL